MAPFTHASTHHDHAATPSGSPSERVEEEHGADPRLQDDERP